MASSNREILLDPATATRAGLEPLPPTRLSSLLSEGPELARELFPPSSGDDLADALGLFGSLSAIAAEALDRHDGELLVEAIGTLAVIWALGNRDAMLPLQPPDPEASLWESLAVNIYALGGIAVRQERWAEIRELTLQDPSPEARGCAKDRSQVLDPRETSTCLMTRSSDRP